jgi:phage-related protein
MINYVKPALKDIVKFPEEIKADLMDALAQLDVGIKLSMPLSRPMPSIGEGVHELRLKEVL